MPLYIAQSGDLVRCYRCLTDSQTLKDRATQLLKKYKSGAFVTQQALINLHTRISKTTKIASIETALMEFHLARTPASNHFQLSLQFQ